MCANGRRSHPTTQLFTHKFGPSLFSSQPQYDLTLYMYAALAQRWRQALGISSTCFLHRNFPPQLIQARFKLNLIYILDQDKDSTGRRLLHWECPENRGWDLH